MDHLNNLFEKNRKDQKDRWIDNEILRNITYFCDNNKKSEIMPIDSEWNCFTELKYKIDQIRLKIEEIENDMIANKERIKS